MPDREKVIRGLGCCFNPHSEHSCLCRCADCPYNPPEDDDWNQQCQIELNRDALALLKEQKPHKNSFTVIDKHTGKYPNVVSIARRCKWAKNLIYCDIDQFVIGEDGTLMLTDDCGNVAYCPADRFEVIWDACQNAGKGYCDERMDN